MPIKEGGSQCQDHAKGAGSAPCRKTILWLQLISETPGETLLMSIDEYEAIRLIDLEGLSQEECAESMNVSRTTAQSIYNGARRKLAECLVVGKALRVEGGDYILCEESSCKCGSCRKKRGSSDTSPAQSGS